MREYFSEAVVLHREPRGELDFSISLFTERYGKIVAKARSARKITSKNSAHLLPGKVADVRIVEQRGIQVVDALSSRTILLKPFDLYFLHTILSEWECDPEIWAMLTQNKFSWPKALQILGWAGEVNYCIQCGEPNANIFYGKTQELYCQKCIALRGRVRPEEYITLG